MKHTLDNPEAWGGIFGRHVAQEHGIEPTDEQLSEQWRKLSGTAPFGPAFAQFREAARERACGELVAAKRAGELLAPDEAEQQAAALEYSLARAQDSALTRDRRLEAAAEARRGAYGFGWTEMGLRAAQVEEQIRREGGQSAQETKARAVDAPPPERRAGGRS